MAIFDNGSSRHTNPIYGVVVIPHFLMLCEASDPSDPQSAGTWKFMCQQLNGDQRIDVSEEEPGMSGQRLHLLSVIRGLESLEQSSRVSLITGSSYVGRGIRHSLEVWKENNWEWEHFGVMRPIKHRFLWRRIERVLQHHDVECRVWKFESAKEPQTALTRKNESVIRPSAIRPTAVQSPAIRPPQVKPTPQEQVKIWANELANRLASMGLPPIQNYATQ